MYGQEVSKISVQQSQVKLLDQAANPVYCSLAGDIPPKPEVVMVLYPEGYHASVTVEVEDTQPTAEPVEGETSVSRRKEVRFLKRSQIYLGIVRHFAVVFTFLSFMGVSRTFLSCMTELFPKSGRAVTQFYFRRTSFDLVNLMHTTVPA